MAYQNNGNFPNGPKKTKIQFADFAEVISVETISQGDLSDYDKELGIKSLVIIRVEATQKFGNKTYSETAHFGVKVANSEGLKPGDSVLVKGSHTEGKRWISGATLRLLKKS